MKCQRSLKMGHVGTKTRSLGQILEKPSVPSRGHIFSLILMKLGQNVCLNIHAIRPGLSGTVPDFDTLSRRPGNYEIVPEIPKIIQRVF